MFPPVFKTLRASPAVVAIVVDRIGRHGEIAQGEQRPYITWQIISGLPFDQISGPPAGDLDSVQIDCFHATDTGVEELALAVRAALDQAGHANRVTVDARDPDTKLYRVGIDADFIASR